MRRLIVGGGAGVAVATSARRIALRGAMALAIALAGLVTWVAAGGTGSADAQHGAPVAALDTMPAPRPPDEATYIKDKTAAIKLGKALFWDMQAGSDGRQACATCHFAAGADDRSRNQINPRMPAGAGTPVFELKGPNAQLTADDFPFHKLADPNDAASVLSDTSNVAGSQGVMPSTFDGVTPGEPADDQTFATSDPDFNVNGTPVRRTTGRNTPSVINAVFNFRNFWDGRAQNDFNGVDPFGSRDTAATVGKADADGVVSQVHVDITNSSLASQSVGPPGNPVEMSSDGRTLSDIGTKLLSLRPLRTQIVSPNDSVLGADVDPSGRGIRTSYADLVKAAFQPDWWSSDQTVDGPKGQSYSLMEYNFSLFWGLAIQAYESTLVSDQTPVDRYLRGDASALSPAAVNGLRIFQTTGKCTECHNGPALTDATTMEVANDGPIELDKIGRWKDIGFENIGVRPTNEDVGNGGGDGISGAPLSITRLTGQSGDAVDGTFKVPGLRNVALTAPYFHNGGELTLRQVVDFYSRGGDFANAEKSTNLHVLNLSDQDKDDLVSFLEALTDPRVQSQSAPFDHPELYVPEGAKADSSGNVVTNASGQAADCFRQVPATGAGGGAPLAPFPAPTTQCQDAPDLHNPPPVPHPAPVSAPSSSSSSSSSAPAAPSAAAAGAGAPAPSVAGTGANRGRCVVPRLSGRTVAQARRMLARSHCRLGLVLRARRARGRLVVSSQRPSAGARRPVGTRVAVRLRTHKRPHHKR
jgi:cytochrome c peroxidase